MSSSSPNAERSSRPSPSSGAVECRETLDGARRGRCELTRIFRSLMTPPGASAPAIASRRAKSEERATRYCLAVAESAQSALRGAACQSILKPVKSFFQNDYSYRHVLYQLRSHGLLLLSSARLDRISLEIGGWVSNPSPRILPRLTGCPQSGDNSLVRGRSCQGTEGSSATRRRCDIRSSARPPRPTDGEIDYGSGSQSQALADVRLSWSR